MAVLLDHYRTKRKYVNADFPLPKQKFDEFRAELRSELAASLGVDVLRVFLSLGDPDRCVRRLRFDVDCAHGARCLADAELPANSRGSGRGR